MLYGRCAYGIHRAWKPTIIFYVLSKFLRFDMDSFVLHMVHFIPHDIHTWVTSLD